MELIYSMRRKPLKCEPPQFERAADPEVVRPLVTISSCNIIAFSSPTELTDTDGDTWGGHVYVCDLDTPWDSHKVISTTHPVSALEWDMEGKQLLVATTEGEVSVLGQKDFLLNEWILLYSATFPGEHIIKAIFFHNGRRLIALDKKHDAPITEKIQALRYTPTLKGFGGVSIGGACVVSMSGLVGALTSGPSPPAAARASNRLTPHHSDHVTHADIAHKNGNLLIAGVSRSGAGGHSVVRCAVCGVSGGPGGAAGAPLAVHTQPLPTLVCEHPANCPPTAISWLVGGGGGGGGGGEHPDALALGGAGAALALWRLAERPHAIHDMLAKGSVQGSTTPGAGQKPAIDCFNTLVWQAAGAWCAEPGAGSNAVRSEAIAGARRALPQQAPLLALAAARKIHLLDIDSHRYICSRVLCVPEPAAVSPPKKPKYGNGAFNARGEGGPGGGCGIVCGVSASALGGALVAVDSRAQLHVLRLPQPWTDIPTPLSVQQASTILEYSLVSGYDCLDILLTLKPNIVEAVYDRLTDIFQRQAAPFQQYYFHSWLKMRIALCRLVSGGAAGVSWLTCLSTLWATWAWIGHSLRAATDRDERPQSAPTAPAAPAAPTAPAAPEDRQLAALLDDHHADHEKALIALELKPELPADMIVVSSLRRALQRVVDIAVTVLACLPHSHGAHGYELWSDVACVALLRKCVCVARAAGLGDAALSRLLQRLHHPPKQDLLEECGAVAAQWAARVWEALPRVGVAAPHGQPYPLYLEYLVEPERLKTVPEPPAHIQDSNPGQTMDAIRYMYLGAGRRWRQCARCGARALPHAYTAPPPAAAPPAAAAPAAAPHPAAQRHAHQRAHDARYIAACRCGGKWTLVSNV